MFVKYLKNKSLDYLEFICIVILFFVLSIISLLSIIASSNNYKEIKKQTNKTFNDMALLSYITNKIKASDDGHIFVEEHEGKNVLVIENKANKCKTFIYQKDEKVYETVVNIDMKYDSTLDGECMYNAKSIKFDMVSENIMCISVVTDEGEKSVYVSIKAI